LESYDIYDNEEAIFGGPVGCVLVTEIETPDGWKPYAGDGVRPTAFATTGTENESGTR
jgi:hypothetical protein